MAQFNTHEMCEQLLLLRTDKGDEIIAMSADETRGKVPTFEPFVAFRPEAVADSLLNMVASSALMYQCLSQQQICVNALLQRLHAAGMTREVSPAVAILESMTTAIQTAQHAAREGINKTHRMIEAERKSNATR